MPSQSSAVESTDRLIELEETLRAIQAGEVDAVVVSGDGEEQVVPLGAEERSCHAFMEAVDMGAAMFDDRGRLVYVNAGLARLLGHSCEEILNSGLMAYLPKSAAVHLEDLIEGTGDERKTAQITLGNHPSIRHVAVSSAPIPTAFGPGRALTFADITDRIRIERSEEVARVGRAIMSSTSNPVLVCDREGLVTEANPALTALLGSSPVGDMIDDALPIVFASETGILTPRDLVAITAGGGSVREVYAELNLAEDTAHLSLNALPLHNSEGISCGCVISIADVTKRRDIEERQRLLMRETDHRMKNMLAMVSAICSRTIATSNDLIDFRERFGHRLESLAAVQTLITDSATTNVRLSDLIQGEFLPYVSLGSSRIQVSGADVSIKRDAAISLGLVIHELVTNAVKYGALSVPEGNISIGVERSSREVCIQWIERGGPSVQKPQHKGFGQTVIARGLGVHAARPTQLDYAPSGVRCTMYVATEAFS